MLHNGPTAGCADPEYVWHDMAQVWQSADGEAAVEAMATAPTEAITETFATDDHDTGGEVLARRSAERFGSQVAAALSSFFATLA